MARILVMVVARTVVMVRTVVAPTDAGRDVGGPAVEKDIAPGSTIGITLEGADGNTGQAKFKN
ncbi:hypothetical protein OZ411_10810 [Bradyrhizobium sp. Arg237L]|uniref:hypothetical protein n=1 Tax=Bradyrhizobium sp. Arg237L TaxID=3003352 RepID=UPI00249F8DA2|nr:hypothetical protein [Bradyrhizobium sp. Arg237L]MDI4233302.1 hypothetical protein [Bradyrhizobium sp. Arg237L]